MSDPSIPEYRVSVDLLRPGVFIRLERINWFKHPFLFSSFKIQDQEQIAVLKGLGITEVICVPEQSDRLPGAPGDRRPPTAETDQAPDSGPDPGQAQARAIERLWEVKRERARRLREKKQRIAECEERFAASVRDLSGLTRRVLSGQPGSVAEAMAFVERLAAQLLGDRESTLHLMNVMTPVERSYSHPVNVAVLAMMLGRETGFSRPDLVALGLGAVFHDIGKAGLEKKILRKRGPLTPAEQTLVRRHPETGRDLLAGIKDLPPRALDVVLRHHERADGSGYPAGMPGPDIGPLASAVAIADVYDGLCNHPDPDESLTPYLALSFMFSQLRPQFDRELLPLFVRCLGVYPPGTVVQLSSGAIGMVMAVNPESQLAPSVVLHDPQIPKKEALIVDLREEPGLRVEKSIRPSHLPPEIFDYLSPRTRISYFVEPER